MKRREHALLIAMTIVTVLVLAGCGSDRTAVSPSDPSGDPSSQEPRFLASPSPMAVPLASPTPVSKFIKAKDGGAISIGRFSLTIPKDALSADAMIIISRTHAERVSFRIDPAGLQLAKPAVISLSRLDNETDAGRFGANIAIFFMDMDAPVPLPMTRSNDAISAQAMSLGDFAIGRQSMEGEPIQFLHYLSGPGFETKLIEASAGGDVTYDRFKVRIPKNALSEDTYITIRDPGSSYLMCELEPHGINFLVPVRFEMTLTGLDWEPYTDWTDYWFNEETGLWERQTGTFDGNKIVDDLSHFSRYVAGRAGW